MIFRSVDSLDHSLMVVWYRAVVGTPGQQLSDLRSTDCEDLSDFQDMLIPWTIL